MYAIANNKSQAPNYTPDCVTRAGKHPARLRHAGGQAPKILYSLEFGICLPAESMQAGSLEFLIDSSSSE
jgi:hypothetical protein